jgi:hypothetical protein
MRWSRTAPLPTTGDTVTNHHDRSSLDVLNLCHCRPHHTGLSPRPCLRPQHHGTRSKESPLDSSPTRSEPEMPSRCRGVDHYPTSIHRGGGWTERIQPLSSPGRQLAPPRRPRHALNAQHKPHYREPRPLPPSPSSPAPPWCQQLRSQAPPRHPQPHRSGFGGPPRPEAPSRTQMASATGASPPAGPHLSLHRCAKPVAEATAPRRHRAMRRSRHHRRGDGARQPGRSPAAARALPGKDLWRRRGKRERGRGPVKRRRGRPHAA